MRKVFQMLSILLVRINTSVFTFFVHFHDLVIIVASRLVAVSSLHHRRFTTACDTFRSFGERGRLPIFELRIGRAQRYRSCASSKEDQATGAVHLAGVSRSAHAGSYNNRMLRWVQIKRGAC
jgi:hypothetical protein